MLEEIRKAREKLAAQLIKKMEKRQFEACYCETKEEAFDKVVRYLDEGCTVACGGSATLGQLGVKEYLLREDGKKYHYIRDERKDYRDFNQKKPKIAKEKREIFAQEVRADYYLMSANAITADGELVNIDGIGNRVAALSFGPEYVIVVAGLNKVARNVEEAIWRVRNIAAPPNAVRHYSDTPCTVTGSCANCLKPDCICADVLVTRFSWLPGRIKVILVGEDLGY